MKLFQCYAHSNNEFWTVVTLEFQCSKVLKDLHKTGRWKSCYSHSVCCGPGR